MSTEQKKASERLLESAAMANQIRAQVLTMEAELDRLRRLARNLLDPDMYGFAVSGEVRDAARIALGIAPCETKRGQLGGDS